MVLNERLSLNLREMVDEKLFWYAAIYNSIEDAIKYNYNLKFIFDNGKKPINISMDLSIIIR
jgi:hypothetical protein